MSSHIASLGDSIEKTSSNYNKFIGSMDSKVLPKFEEISKFYPSAIGDKNKKPKIISDSVRKSSKLIKDA
jgi:DNA anti-recombination protein RmuC